MTIFRIVSIRYDILVAGLGIEPSIFGYEPNEKPFLPPAMIGLNGKT